MAMLKNLAYRQVRDAQVQVFDWPVGGGGSGFCGGPVLTEEGDDQLRHTRRGRPVDRFRPDEDYEERLDGHYVYAGPLHHHFGHYMAEFVHRIVPARVRGLNFPFLFVSTRGHNPYPSYGDFPDFVKEALTFLGVLPRDVRIVNCNTIVETLHVIEAGSDLYGGPKPGYLEAIAKYCGPRLDARHGTVSRPRRLYVSRSALKPQGMILGEAWFEQHLEREGFTVFRPEEWRFSPQMDHYRKAEIVIFSEGSSCHGAEFLGKEMMQRTFILPRRDNGAKEFLQPVLKNRSQMFSILDGCTKYIGSAAANNLSRTPLPRTGVSWLDVEKTIAAFRAHGLAELADFSQRDYATAARVDLDRHLAFQSRPGGPYDAEHAAALIAAFEQCESVALVACSGVG